MIDFSETIDHDYYNIKSTDYDRQKRVKSWKMSQDSKSHPLCAFCLRRCFDPDIVGFKALKKCKVWRGANKFCIWTNVMMDYSDEFDFIDSE